MTQADLDELVDLARSVYRHDGYPPYLPGEDFERFLKSGNPLAAWVSADQRAITGHVSLHASSSPGVVDLAATQLGVEPTECGVVARLLVSINHRRTGLGQRLLGHAAEECRHRGLTPILDVVERFAPAIALYERAGWTRLGSVDVQLPDGSTMTEHVYSTDEPVSA